MPPAAVNAEARGFDHAPRPHAAASPGLIAAAGFAHSDRDRPTAIRLCRTNDAHRLRSRFARSHGRPPGDRKNGQAARRRGGTAPPGPQGAARHGGCRQPGPPAGGRVLAHPPHAPARSGIRASRLVPAAVDPDRARRCGDATAAGLGGQPDRGGNVPAHDAVRRLHQSTLALPHLQPAGPSRHDRHRL